MHISLVPRESNNNWLCDFFEKLKIAVSLGKGRDEFVHELDSICKEENDLDNIMYDVTQHKSNSDTLEKVTILRENLSQFLVKKVIIEYIRLLDKNKLALDKDMDLAFDFYGKGILVWIRTEKEDEEVEVICELIEKEINERYRPLKLSMRTNVFDKSYGFEFPPRYIV